MNSRILGFLLVGASVMLGANKADKPAPGTDAAVAEQVRHEVVMYPRYTIWDDVRFRVTQGQVELTGIRDEIKVLPLSDQDDRLRLQVARAIYRDPVFTRYAMQAQPPIHIIVENGHVTLDGVVSTTMEKQIAGLRASTAGLSFGPVVNNLQVENPPAKKS